MSFLNGKFPSVLKRIKVIPIHKRQPKVGYGNHTPISLLSLFRKQSSVALLMGQCSGNKRQVCGVTSVPKDNFNRVAIKFYCDDTSGKLF